MRNLIFLLVIQLLQISCVKKTLDLRDEPINSYFDKAVSFKEIGKIDSSFIYYDKAKEEFISRKDSANVAKCFANMAFIALNEADFYGAQDLSLKAISFYNHRLKIYHEDIAFSYNNLARACYFMKEYTNALKYYDEAISFSHESNLQTWYLNNKAKLFEDNLEFQKAIQIYSDILKHRSSTSQQYAMILANYSFTKWLQDKSFNPVPQLLKSLEIRKRERDYLGQNFVYARLADYYFLKQPSLAKVYAEKMHAIANQLRSPDDQLEALEKLVKLSSGVESKVYFEQYRKLEDSVQIERAKSKNQFALIRYETEKHKAKNLILEKENSEKKYQLIKQQSTLIGGLVLAFFTVVFSIVLYQKRKQKILLLSHNAIHENQLKTSKKVHDVVANGIYRVMAEIENSENLDRLNLLDKLEDMYEKSRNLSYEELNYVHKNFHHKITGLLKSFASEGRKVVFVGYTEELWKNVDVTVKYEIEHILQELMVNMNKHSNASSIAVRFEKIKHKISITYTDNGVGMSKDEPFKNGLTNTGNRIVNIKGEITFDTEMERGLKIRLSFPVS